MMTPRMSRRSNRTLTGEGVLLLIGWLIFGAGGWVGLGWLRTDSGWVGGWVDRWVRE